MCILDENFPTDQNLWGPVTSFPCAHVWSFTRQRYKWGHWAPETHGCAVHRRWCNI